MPWRELHEAITEGVLGEKFTDIHVTKDKPSKWAGKRHRKYLHDPFSNLIIAAAKRKTPKEIVKAYLAAELHDFTDREFTKFKRRFPPEQRDMVEAYLKMVLSKG